MRILVIEDDAILSEAITHRLKSLGHGVDFTRSGQQAKPMLEHQEYDLILLDLNLPDTSGAQLLTAFRNAKHTTPVLVVTARHQVEERVRLLDLGADDYITK
ncbi:response regulator, partial [Escherichia coli]|uniref:response regulator n=1 Tax=Escherichia coli TaxID=562 RepID=UPI003FA5E493